MCVRARVCVYARARARVHTCMHAIREGASPSLLLTEVFLVHDGVKQLSTCHEPLNARARAQVRKSRARENLREENV